MKNIPNILNENECELLKNFLNNFLQSINDEKIIISTLKDLEIISSIAGLVAYLYQNKNLICKEDLREWREFIDKHRLPEVREHRDLLL